MSERDQLQNPQGRSTGFNAGLTGERRSCEERDGTHLTLEGCEAQTSPTERQMDEAKTDTDDPLSEACKSERKSLHRTASVRGTRGCKQTKCDSGHSLSNTEFVFIVLFPA